jgi:cytochrome c biogenesis protein CcmG/thiol:disulfide interchange protein DsbE
LKSKAIVIAVIVAIGVAVVVLNKGAEDRQNLLPVAEGLEAPDIRVNDLDGDEWQLSTNRGEVILLNFWATWCDTCKEEMPSLQHLYDTLKDEPNFRLVTILYNDAPLNAVNYLKDNNYTLPLYMDPNGIAGVTYGLTGVPETYVVDKKGVLRKKIIGPSDFDNPDALAFFKRLLAEGS